MARSVRSSQKCCATCAHWAGPRTVNNMRDTVIMEGNYTPTGKCYLKPNIGGSNGPTGDWCCPSNNSNYTKWSALK